MNDDEDVEGSQKPATENSRNIVGNTGSTKPNSVSVGACTESARNTLIHDPRTTRADTESDQTYSESARAHTVST